MKRKLAVTGILLLALSVLAGCVGGNTPVKGEDDVKPAIYFSFDEDGDKVVDGASQQQYPVHYVFQDAKYKQSEPAKRVKGVSGNALSFDGYSTYVQADGLAEDVSALTVSLWVAPRGYATRTDGRLTGLVSAMGASGGFDLGMYNYGKWCFRAVSNRGELQLWSEEAIIDLYRWNYLTAVFDGDAGQMRLYKNGEMVASCDISASMVKAGSEMLVGKAADAAMVEDVFQANMFAGLMDELEIRTQALSDEQVMANYQKHAGDLALDVQSALWLDPEILSDDRYAPQYHLRVSQNWQNETYGFFYYNGYYHAFCQQNVLGPYYTDGQRWGHFVSSDLVHWQELTPALLPNGEPKLFYTGVNYSGHNLNLIATAQASDLSDPKLTNWTKSQKVVVEQGNHSTRDNFRDPFIYEQDGVYYMLIGGTNTQTGGGAIYCYRATDDTLESWEYLSMLYSGDSRAYRFLGNCYELPNLFRLTNKSGTLTKHLLMFSPIGDINGVYYLLGDFDPKTGIFTPDEEEPQRYDLGPKSQVLCPSGFYDPHTGRNLLITMSRTGMDAQERYDSGWSTVMTLVKELSLSDTGELLATPIAEYDSLNKACLLDVKDASLTLAQANERLASVHADMLRIDVTIDPGQDSEVGMYVKYDASAGERVCVSYETQTEQFSIDTSKSSLDMRNNGAGGEVVALNGDEIRLTVFVDRAMVEAYLNDKNQVTAFGYNTSAAADGVKLFSSGGTAVVKSLSVYELSSSTGYDVPAYWEN